MNREAAESFDAVEAAIEGNIKDEKLRALALVVSDLCRGTAELTSGGFCAPERLDATMQFAVTIQTIISGLDAGIPVEQLREAAQAGPLVALGQLFGEMSEN